jgi:hypothetical protein
MTNGDESMTNQVRKCICVYVLVIVHIRLSRVTLLLIKRRQRANKTLKRLRVFLQIRVFLSINLYFEIKHKEGWHASHLLHEYST